MNEDTKNAIEAATAATVSKTFWVSTISAILGAITSAQFIGLVSLSIAVVSFVANLYFKRRSDQRDQREHEAWMKKNDRESHPIPLRRDQDIL